VELSTSISSQSILATSTILPLTKDISVPVGLQTRTTVTVWTAINAHYKFVNWKNKSTEKNTMQTSAHVHAASKLQKNIQTDQSFGDEKIPGLFPGLSRILVSTLLQTYFTQRIKTIRNQKHCNHSLKGHSIRPVCGSRPCADTHICTHHSVDTGEHWAYWRPQLVLTDRSQCS